MNHCQDRFGELWDFRNNKKSDIQSIIHCINLLGDNLVGLELGIFKADSFMTVLHNCPNVKLLHGVDLFQPFHDYIKEPYDGTIANTIGYKDIDLAKTIAINKIKFSGMQDKTKIYEMDSEEALKYFEPESLDFIFVDTYLTEEQVVQDLESWYPIVKTGGLFAGHDYFSSAVSNPVKHFRESNGITNTMSVFDGCFCWIK
tara:strand:- start:94 stop:696 length:603 start_codon:yes stop_codon:yes gene_type:complete